MATTNEGFDAAGLRFRMNLIIFIENSTLAEKNQDSISRICNAKSTPILSIELTYVRIRKIEFSISNTEPKKGSTRHCGGWSMRIKSLVSRFQITKRNEYHSI